MANCENQMNVSEPVVYLFVDYRLSHNLLNFWNKLQAGLSTSGLDNYAALCRPLAKVEGALFESDFCPRIFANLR